MRASRWKTGRILRGAVVLVPVLVLAAALVRRSRYPEGTFWRQQRTRVELIHPDIAEVLRAVVPGVTPATDLTDRLGPPSDVVARDGLELWVFTTGSRRHVERAILGLIPTGESIEVVQSQMPVGVRDGVVVHTYPSPSPDAATKEAVESMWDAYVPAR